MTEQLSKQAIKSALISAHGRVVGPAKHKWPDGYVNEDYPYKPFWAVLMSSLEKRLEQYQQLNAPEPTENNDQSGLSDFA